MASNISYCLLAATFALIATQTTAEPQQAVRSNTSGAWNLAMDGIPGRAKLRHARGREFRAISGYWLAEELPAYFPLFGVAGYLELDEALGVGYGHPCYEIGSYSHHPYGACDYWPAGTYRGYRSMPTYVGFAPDAKIISVHPKD